MNPVLAIKNSNYAYITNACITLTIILHIKSIDGNFKSMGNIKKLAEADERKEKYTDGRKENYT